MDVVQQWSMRIAQRVTPEESDFAAEVGAAYAAGGKARKSLLARHDVQPGAFGPGASTADLPAILQSLAYCGHAIMALLRDPYVTDTLATGSLLATLKLTRDRRRMGATASDAAELEQSRESIAQLTERQIVGHALESLSDRLSNAGFAPARADNIAYELIAEMLTDAADAARFVDALTAVPPARAIGARRRTGRGWPRQESEGR